MAIPNLFLIHQTGLEEYDKVLSAYKGLPLWEKCKEQIRVYSFIEDMGWAYAQADLVVGRAGATTVAEILALKKPAILIPYPYATHRHQEKNAEALEKVGVAKVFKQEALDKVKFFEEIKSLFLKREKLEEMKQAFKKFELPCPQKIILDEMKKIV